MRVVSAHYFNPVLNSGAGAGIPANLLMITSKQYIIISFFTTDMIRTIPIKECRLGSIKKRRKGRLSKQFAAHLSEPQYPLTM